MTSMRQPFYDSQKSYQENFTAGPFGAFADNEILSAKAEPADELFGHKVNLAFGIPAGPLINGKFVKAALAKGFDLPVYKTVRTRQYPCHPWPNVLAVHPGGGLALSQAEAGLIADKDYRQPLSITNSFGVPSPRPDFWQPDLASAVRAARPGQVVIASFQGTDDGGGMEEYVKDFVLAARLVKETGVKIMEVNLSCPNEGGNKLLCFSVAAAARVVAGIKDEIGNTPLLLKIAYFENDDSLRRFVREAAALADGITAINTITAVVRDKQGEQALPGPGRLRSGVCGTGIKWAGLEMARRLARLREESGKKFAIAGCGGVMSPADYQEYRQAGADAVFSATGAMWNPYLARDVKKKVL